MVVVPVVRPLTIPVDASMVASEVLLLLHVPPVVALARVMVVPVQTDVGPVMAGGAAVTVTTVAEVQLPTL